MQNKMKFCRFFLILVLFMPVLMMDARAAVADVELIEDIEIQDDNENLDQASADAVAAYNVEGSLFEQITTLEQERF